MSAALARLFSPRSVAVIGGGRWGENVITRCRAIGFDGPIWPVHPERAKLAGEPAFAAIDALPAPPDAAFIGINRESTISAVAELAARGAGGAVCFASGFRETQGAGGADLQEVLLRAAADMPLLGPNCYGFVNYLDGVCLWPDQHGGTRCDTGVAIVTQSSNIALNLTMQRRALPLGFVATAGNQAGTGLAEIGAALLADPRITALGLHVEGVGDIGKLEALAAAARRLNKPVVVLKVGRSAAARAAAVSHTAALAGSEAGARALFARLGMVQVNGLGAFVEALKLLHFAGPLTSAEVASMSCSGGEASLVADLALGRQLTFPALAEAQKRRLRRALGPLVTPANPLDYHTFAWGDADAMARGFAAMLEGAAGIGLVVADFPRSDRCSQADWDCVIEAAARARAVADKPVALVSSLPENMPEALAEGLTRRGLVPMAGLEDALAAVRAAAEAGRPVSPAAPVLPPAAQRNPRTWNEARAKAALAALGLRVPRAAVARDGEEAAARATALGFPVALKGLGVAHKSEAGAVALGLESAQAVREAARAMPADSFLVEEMITGAVAEMLIGVVVDEAHGFVLTLGAGGVLAELVEDTTSLLLPVCPRDVECALTGLKIARLMDGWRGGARADKSAIVQAAMAVQAFVMAHRGQVAEVEINPLICRPGDAVVADALIRMGENDD